MWKADNKIWAPRQFLQPRFDVHGQVGLIPANLNNLTLKIAMWHSQLTCLRNDLFSQAVRDCF